ncbi:RNA-binding protein 12 [Araneus ventricosus]|uniref:RNA-binding protein 12 n=1 Tax=Araneus ventricosus TaxID=182803 RepID=A0A4Y2CEK1_ARAVE|nr:RNA-binding protein 12 [Araneus ventricosus]
MSIIIRLQNLPLSAKSGDIRHFFGGLRIPNGGVHIVGGEKGDAFIAFESDEDARLAMRKDGGKLMTSRVKLYLSSYMEMQHEIERITKEYPDDPDRLSPHERLRRRSPPRVRERSVDNVKHYRSDSPMRSRSAYHTGRGLSPHSRRSPRLRSRSPGFRSRSPRMRSRSPRLRSRSSRSPRRRSRSPHIHGSKRSRSPLSRRSISPLSRSVSVRRSRSVSPYRNDFAGYKSSFYESKNGDRNSYRDERISRQGEYFKREGTSRESASISDWIHKDLSLKEEQAQLEKRITEVLNTGFDAIKKNDAYSSMPNTADVPYSGPSLNSYINPAGERGLQENIHAYSTPNISASSSFPPPNINYINSHNMSMNNQRFPNPPPPIVPITSVPPPPLPMSALPPMNVPPPIQMPAIPPPVPVPNLPPPAPIPAMPPPLPGPPVDVAMPPPGFYITISGLDPNWNFNEVQEMLKGTFVPLSNIKWEIDDHGLKTGTAFIKLSIREDFNHFLHHATYIYNGRLITVSECPTHVVHRYFLPEWPPKGPVDTSQDGNLYYRLKGLPYTVTYDDIIQFFQGLDIADIYIEHENEVATGIGYVGFNNIQDYQEAFKLNGKNIGRRFIHMMVSSKRSMLRLKKKRGDLLSQSRVLIPSTVSPSNPAPDISQSSQRRPLCTLLTGLPQDITPSRIRNFFKDAGPIPDAIHVTLNDKGRPNCRAYAEFNTVRDFDDALKCHGTSLEGKIICVKQILFDEMVKILNTQRAMHCFGKPPALNAPEKSSYMWQPPDVNRGPPMDFSPTDDYRRMPIGPEAPLNRPEVQVFEYGNQSREPTAVQGNMLYEHDNSFDLQQRQRKNSSPFRGEKWPLSNSSLDSRERGDLFSSSKRMDTDRFIRDKFASKVEDFESNRDPVKFEVKTKQPMSKKSELSDAFDRSLKPDFKKKLTKLSPERPSVQESKPSSGKSEKNVKDKKSESSTKVSSDRNIQKKDGRKSPDVFVSSKARNESSTGRSNKSDPKYKGRSVERRRDDYSYKSYPRSPSPVKVRSRNRRSRSQSPYSHDRYPRSDSYIFDEREAVVQISNVDPIIEGPELADFLLGFDVNHDKIIRRIERGKPAWDIRVTFRNYREAERAIRILNGSYLNGVPVDMFFVD